MMVWGVGDGLPECKHKGPLQTPAPVWKVGGGASACNRSSGEAEKGGCRGSLSSQSRRQIWDK